MTAKKIAYAVVIACLLTVFEAYAAGIEGNYGVFRSIGPGFVQGSILTDGTQGPLIDANILDWAFTINDGTETASISASDPGAFVQFNGLAMGVLSATLTQLIFDWSAPGDGFVEFGGHGAHGELWSWVLQNGAGCECELVKHGLIVVDPTRTGLVVVAQVPEVGTLALLGIGLAGMRLSRRRRKTAIPRSGR